MRYIANLLRDCGEISQYVTTDWVPPRNFDRDDIARVIDARYIHVFRALLQYWDLIVFTNHPFGVGMWFSPKISKLYVNHGIHMGKINNDKAEDGVYGRSRVFRPFNRPLYSRMFAASQYEKGLATSATPELEDSVVVTGFLRADKFVEYAQSKKTELRRALGYTATDRVVHIISTWGEGSLYGTVGERILDELKNLPAEYKFIFSLHPRFDEFKAPGSENRTAILGRWERFGVRVDWQMDWEDYTVAADFALSDHSSLCLYHVLLQHPLLLLDVAENEYIEGSTFALMKSCYPLFNRDEDVGNALLRLSKEEGALDLEKLQEQILGYRGEAANRYLAEIFELLNL